LKKSGYAKATIETTNQRLKTISKSVDLDDPEEVRGWIANHECSIGYKCGLVDAYDRYVRFNDLVWSRPFYRREDPIITLPTEERIDRIIQSCKLKHQTEFSLMKECGLRTIELHKLTLRALDLENGIVSIKSAKGGRSRQERIKPQTLALLKTYISKNDLSLNDTIFSTVKNMSKAFQRARDRLAKRYSDPEYLKIKLYDLRHFYGSMLYHQTKDILYVKEKMGHRSITSTMKYMHLINLEESDQFVVKIAESLEQFKDFLSKGFNYVSEFEGKKVLKKRK
jgi:integrase